MTHLDTHPPPQSTHVFHVCSASVACQPSACVTRDQGPSHSLTVEMAAILPTTCARDILLVLVVYGLRESSLHGYVAR